MLCELEHAHNNSNDIKIKHKDLIWLGFRTVYEPFDRTEMPPEQNVLITPEPLELLRSNFLRNIIKPKPHRSEVSTNVQ